MGSRPRSNDRQGLSRHAGSDTISAIILVKAAPVLTADAEEQMCVAGMPLDRPGEWVRLFPVPFRDLDDEAKFRKYQEIAVDVVEPVNDRRPESMTPLRGSINLGEVIDTSDRWARRRRRVAQLPERTMCELVEMNRSQATEDAPSLGVVRLAGPPRFRVLERDAEQLDRWKQRAREQASKPSLFDDPDVSKPPLDIVPWRFMYSYRCLADGCNGHNQTIVDWESIALYRRVRRRSDWQQLMRAKFVDEMFGDDRDTAIFVGNMHQHPTNFLVLGVFWPPAGPVQTSLLG